MNDSTIVIAGATGFIGRNLISGLLDANHKVIALTRGNLPEVCTLNPGQKCPVEWRRCDLYSIQQCKNALKGAKVAYYLAHSMLPTARLTQGGFENFDLLVADNFARAAKKVGIEHIIFLGGFIPNEPDLSKHLKSRLEVEQVLASHGTKVTALRTGIVIGAGGSSFEMMVQVVKKLKFIPCPKITSSLIQPIDLQNLISILIATLDTKQDGYNSYDIGGSDVLSYKNLLSKIASIIGLKKALIHIPCHIQWLEKYLICFLSSSPKELIEPLIESLKHNMIAENQDYQKSLNISLTTIDQSIINALTQIPEKDRHRCCAKTPNWRENLIQKSVRAVHRIPFSANKSIDWIVDKYAHSHPNFLKLLLHTEIKDDFITIYIRLFKIKLLELHYLKNHSFTERAFFLISGGLLMRHQKNINPEKRPRLEFRKVLNGQFCLIAIHDYQPTIPWIIYLYTQALIHLYFMKKFSLSIKNQL